MLLIGESTEYSILHIFIYLYQVQQIDRVVEVVEETLKGRNTNWLDLYTSKCNGNSVK